MNCVHVRIRMCMQSPLSFRQLDASKPAVLAEVWVLAKEGLDGSSAPGALRLVVAAARLIICLLRLHHLGCSKSPRKAMHESAV